MIFFRLLPAIISLLLLAAHFSRIDLTLLAVLIVLFPFAFLIKKAWVLKLIQGLILLGALEWLRSLYDYIQIYQSNNQPWTKLVFIMGGVALFTFVSALLLSTKKIKEHFR
ncbi:MAG TPA: hypothetical protein DCG69_06980 [Bacteroidales bacterium]|nr:hypothetical protein [Bacteroidales bacterium]